MKAEDSRTVDTDEEAPRRNLGRASCGAETDATARLRTKAESSGLMEAVAGRGNLMLAYQRVVRNKGAAGVDGIGIAAFKGHLQRHWPTIKVSLLAGKYIPQPVRRVDIPKPQGGVRTPGVPTVVDRLIQQAVLQVLQPIFEGWTTLAAIAAITERARLGHMVSANTLRNPGLTAKMATTIDHVSGGRAILGIGAGWFEREHEAFGFAFGSGIGERLDRLAEAVPVTASAVAAAADAPQPTNAGGAGYWLQFGAFRQRQGANDLQQQLMRELAWLEPWLAIFDDRALYRVQAGPFASRGDALGAAERVRSMARLQPLLEKHNVDLYVCGHIHNFQHIRVAGSDVDYVVNSSASKSRIVVPFEGALFTSPETGFSLCSATETELTLTFVNAEGKILYQYARTR